MVYTADEEFDDEPFGEEWIEDDNPDDVLLVCPSCHQEVHEDTQQCPHCGDWITPIWPGAESKRTIWIVAVALVILSFLMMTIY